MAKNKSIFDEILDWGSRGISGLTSNVQKAATPIANSFTQNYRENIKKQSQQTQRNRQQINNFTNNLISTGQKAGTKFLDFYTKTQKPDLIGLNTPLLKVPENDKKRMGLALENARTQIPLTLGALSTQIGSRIQKGSILPPEYEQRFKAKFGRDSSDAFKGWRTKDIFPQLAPSLTNFGNKQIQEGMKQQAAIEAKKQQLPQPKNFREEVIQGLEYNAPSFLMALGARALATRFAGPTAGSIVGTAVFYPLNTGDIVSDAKSHGATDEEASQLAITTGALITMLDNTGISFILRKMPGGVGTINNIVKRVLGYIESGVVEGGTETIQGFIQDAVAKERYDLSRNPFDLRRRKLEVVLGFIIGGGAGLAIGTATPQPISTPEKEVPVAPPESFVPSNQANLNPAVAQFQTDPVQTSNQLKKLGGIVSTDQLVKGATDGAYITPDGEIVSVGRNHEAVAQRLFPNAKIPMGELANNGIARIIITPTELNLSLTNALTPEQIDSLKKIGDGKFIYYDQFDVNGKLIDGGTASSIDELLGKLQAAPNTLVGAEGALPQAISPDTGNIVKEGPVVNTTPSLPNEITVKDSQGVIAGFFTPEEMRYMNPSEDIIQTDGQRALGKYFDAIIAVGQKDGMVETKTLYHEIFHASVDNFTDPALYRAALNEVIQIEGMTQEKADNRLAEIFPDYIQGKPIKGDATRRLFEAIRNKERPLPQAQAGVRFGITSAQIASPVVGELFNKGNVIFNSGDINQGLSTLQQVTTTTLPELQGLLDKYGVVVKHLEVDTHGLYFNNPEPSYDLTVDRDSEANAIRAIAEFAKHHAQDSFISAKRSSAQTATPGFTLTLERVLTNQEVVNIEKIANDHGIGLTLNQRTGEIVAYNINSLDGLTEEQFQDAYDNIRTDLTSGGFSYKARLDFFDSIVYNNSQYEQIIRGENETIQPRTGEAGVVSQRAGRLGEDNTPQYRPEQYLGYRGTEISQKPQPEVPRVRREPNSDIRSGAQNYNQSTGFPPIKENFYIPVNESMGRQIADAYDALPKVDNSPETFAAYAALGIEIQAQWDYATRDLGIVFDPWTQDGQPYANSQEMVDDIANNKHLSYYTGGQEHPFLSHKGEDGITLNDKFRAVHDLFGHAAEGYGFGPR